MIDDDLTRMTAIRWCGAYESRSPPGGRKDFKGFTVYILSDVSGYSSMTFGTVDGADPDTRCATTYFGDEELMYFQAWYDDEDIEGMYFRGHRGTNWYMRADGERGGSMF